MNKKVKFAIVGTGMIAEKHALAIQDAENAVLFAVFDRNYEKAKKFAKKFNSFALENFDNLLNSKDIQAVTIATPTGVHADVAVPLAKAGKHLLCEKPLDINLKRADAIIDACEENNVLLSAVFQARFSENVRLIKDTLDSQRFGKLILSSAQVKWYRSQEYYDSGAWRGTWALDGGGALMNQSIHLIDLLLYFTGKPVELYAYMATRTHDIEVEDTACATIKFANGGLGTVEVSTSCAPGFDRKLELSGEHGSITLEDETITRWKFDKDLPEDEKIINKDSDISHQTGASDPSAIGYEGHKKQIVDLATAISKGEDLFIPGKEGRRAIELIEAIYTSAKTAKPYKF